MMERAKNDSKAGERDLEPEKVDLKKSTKILYVSDLIFVFIVGLVLFLISWFLCHYSNAMAMRFIGLAVASFGYVLCIFYFLDATFLFFLKRDG